MRLHGLVCSSNPPPRASIRLEPAHIASPILGTPYTPCHATNVSLLKAPRVQRMATLGRLRMPLSQKRGRAVSSNPHCRRTALALPASPDRARRLHLAFLTTI